MRDAGWHALRRLRGTRPPGNTETGVSPGRACLWDLAGRTSWPEAVLRDLRLLLPAREARIAATVVASLDDRGYLTEACSVLAGLAGCDLACAERVIRTLRETGPAGIAARDLRDCLLLQALPIAGQALGNKETIEWPPRSDLSPASARPD